MKAYSFQGQHLHDSGQRHHRTDMTAATGDENAERAGGKGEEEDDRENAL